MVSTIKFSQMTSGGDLDVNDKTPGLLSGNNVLFNNPWPNLAPGSTADRPPITPDIYFRLRFNTTTEIYEFYSPSFAAWIQLDNSAVQNASFITYQIEPSLPNSFDLGSLTDGILKQTVSLGVSTPSIALNGVDYYGPGFTGYINAPAGISDFLNNPIVNFHSIILASNSLYLTNAFTGFSPNIGAQGLDTDIGLTFQAQGAGLFNFRSTNSTPMQFNSGTSNQHNTNFIFADTPNTVNVTWQDFDGTVAYLSDIPGGGVTSAQGTDNQVLVNGTFGAPVTGAITLTTPQDIGLTSSPTFQDITLTGPLNAGGTIFAASGDKLLELDALTGAVNHLNISNSLTGFPVALVADGTDSDVTLLLSGKNNGDVHAAPRGTGALLVGGASAPAYMKFLEDPLSGTNYIGFKAPTTVPASYYLTFPSAVPPSTNSIITYDTSGIGSWTIFQEAQTYTPTITFATPGDLSVVYTVQSGTYEVLGRLVMVNLTVSFTPTYTTSSGEFIISLPIPVFHTLPSSVIAVVGPVSGGITYPAGRTQLNPVHTPGQAQVVIRALGSATAQINLATTEIVSGSSYSFTIATSYIST